MTYNKRVNVYLPTPVLFTCLRTSLLSFVLIITITLIFTGLSSPSAYAECSGMCLYGRSENPMDLPAKTADDHTESTNDIMNLIQKDQQKDEIEVNKPYEDHNSGNYLSDNIELSNLLSGATAENTLPGTELIMDDSDENSLVASNQSNISNTLMNTVFQATNKNDWEFIAVLYFWFVGIDGKVAVKGIERDVNVSFGDIWEDFDFGIQGHFEFQKNKWGGMFDGSWLRLKTSGSLEGPAGILKIRTKSEMNFAIFELAGTYEIGHWSLSKEAPKVPNPKAPSLKLDAYGGGRLWYLDQDVKIRQAPPPLPGSINVNETWFDFIVGGKVALNATKNLTIRVRSDIGGFGLGFSSDFAWNTIASIGYQFPHGITAGLAYRIIYEKYENGSGDNRFLFDAWMRGSAIFLGVAF